MLTRRRTVLFGLLALAACQGASPAAPDTIAFTHVNVLPMTSEAVVADQTVVVVNGVITEVGPSDVITVGEGATLIDGTGQYLMPGLAEMHAHVPSMENPPRDAVDDILFLYIANGVTTIRGMLGSDYQIPLADELETGTLLGPTLYVGAPSINGTSAPTPEAAEELVRRHKAAGYDLQKIHPGVSLESWDHMVEVAQEVGITFGGHVPADVGLVHAIETGMSTVDHLDGYVKAIASDDVVSQVNAGATNLAGLMNGVDEDKLAAIIQLSVDHDVYVVPTMYLWENLYGAPDVDAVLSQPEMKYVSQGQRDAWRRQAAAGPAGTPEEVAAFFALRKRILKDLSDAGVGILMGTDSPQMFNVPGYALHRELAVVAESGMSNYAILRSGTAAVGRYVADHLGLDGHFGTVAPGQRADLVLLGTSPLDALANLTDRVGVMVRGKWVPRADIDAGLAALAAKHASGGE